MTVPRPCALRSDAPPEPPAPRPPGARVVAFAPAARPRIARDGERRGEILLFLGVRYERRAS